ncbi:hypothetical protein OH77DRAFT_1427961 [Trametes cingulata]|nr:hypothetical protein OH77DRAFT_1427961 [Trametes cingulata]
MNSEVSARGTYRRTESADTQDHTGDRSTIDQEHGEDGRCRGGAGEEETYGQLNGTGRAR